MKKKGKGEKEKRKEWRRNERRERNIGRKE